ncbi:MAG: hypothetical protein RM338_09680 [Nostoc sp. DedQUE12a]|nr:hypothetical protein [Nostoc sp. DedQUE12a]
MSRPKRNLQSGFCYHITTRCNNREFRLDYDSNYIYPSTRSRLSEHLTPSPN